METSQQASARRVELDYPCYLRTVAEWFVALAPGLVAVGSHQLALLQACRP